MGKSSKGGWVPSTRDELVYASDSSGFYRYVHAAISPEGNCFDTISTDKDENFFNELQEQMWQDSITECFWATTGKPVAFSLEQGDEIFGTCEDNISAKVIFEQDPYTGLTTSGIKEDG